MKVLFSLLLCVCSFASARTPIQVEAFPGRVKVLVDLNMSQGSPVDILFVVDDSGSMSAHQANLRAHIPLLIGQLTALNLDYNAGVISTTVDSDGTVGSQGKLAGPVVTRTTGNGAAVLARQIEIGAIGSGFERHFSAVKMALTEPNLSGSNAGFLRSAADLSIIFVSDAEDQSDIGAPEFISFLNGLKTGNQNITVQGLIVPSGVTDCDRDPSSNGGPDPEPKKLEEVVEAFKGNSFSLCDSRYLENVVALAQKLARPGSSTGNVPVTDISRIELPSEPEFGTVVVRYGTQIIPAGNVNKGWIFDSAKNEILMGSEIVWSVQPLGTLLEIEYVPAKWTK